MIKYKPTFPALMATVALGFGIAAAPPAQAAINSENSDFSQYDYNNDEGLGEDEWRDYSYNAIDYNDDNMIDENEWNDYTTVWYEPLDMTYDDGTFTDYDANGDGLLDDSEYSDAYDENLFSEWDDNEDGVLSNNEYDTAFSSYDDQGEAGVFDW